MNAFLFDPVFVTLYWGFVLVVGTVVAVLGYWCFRK